MDTGTLAAAIAVSKKIPGTAAQRAEAAEERAEAAADRAQVLSQALYMGSDGKFYIDIEEE